MRFTGVGGTLRRPWLGGMRGVMGVAALAAGLVLALSVMPACGSGCPTPEQRAYLEEVEDWSDRAEAATRNFARIAEEPGRRAEALIDEGWRRRLRRVLDEMNSANEEMRGVAPPSGTEELHRALVLYGEAVIEANELYWRGVLDIDAETLERSNARRREASRVLFGELLPAAESFCE